MRRIPKEVSDMKRNDWRFIVNIIEILAGAALLVLGLTGVVDEFWEGMGTALIVVGMLMFIRQIRYRTNAEFKKELDVKVKDERNRFIAMKSWSWAGYTYVMVAAVGTIVAKILGHDDIMMMLSGSVCFILVFYWLFYLILQKRY